MTSTTTPATVKMIAMLHGWCTAHGVATNQQVKVPEEGITARALAVSLTLPVDMIDGVFLDHRGAGLDAVVRPGSRVAFVPHGTPASHPAFFGEFRTRT